MSRPRIASAQAYEGDPNEIIIELDNGSAILLELKPKLGDPLFSEISGLAMPRTDGERVYWANGASLTLDEIMEMLESETDIQSEN
ncbi:hypothetical protein KL86CLO1_12556 [uncultured Eubacteriales bacterium]|uniref:DUF2442 domain-containing protein n=1 Tax=uncultured Eubacteriales bacterium TaxID=172733 RepID=A0A212KBC2_9FIRM|nr:hypothetical protein KL86CLO1_12556 [uncultured Eubacteriales bacterium]